jgi:outer membrane protein
MRPTATMPTDCRGLNAFGRMPATRAALVAMLLAVAIGAHAQSPDDERIRIGFVDMVRLFDNAPQLIAARRALDEEFRPRYDALSSDEARLETLTARMLTIADVDSPDRLGLEREIRNLQRSINRRREDLAQEIRFRTNAEKNAIEDTIQIAIRQVAEAGGFDLVLTGPVAFASQRVDITDRVIQWLEQDYAADSDAVGSLP